MPRVIKLFNTTFDVDINPKQYNNLLYDKEVRDFEEAFALHVGAKYACSLSSATAGIFLTLKAFEDQSEEKKVRMPSMLPPVVANAVLNAGYDIEFEDNPFWVGGPYDLHKFKDFTLVDSAQEVTRDQYRDRFRSKKPLSKDIMLFSFYPTKPIGSCDGGMVVSDDSNQIEKIRILANNGALPNVLSWENDMVMAGWKMYMNTIQAKIAHHNLVRLGDKRAGLKRVRSIYNEEFGYRNDSYHLYRVKVKENYKSLYLLKKKGITCGVHYAPLHQMGLYRKYGEGEQLGKSEHAGMATLSIPFHEELTDKEIETVIKNVKECMK
jgi:dTDP-4-amino-4,6-dideoxygalactose transaminase